MPSCRQRRQGASGAVDFPFWERGKGLQPQRTQKARGNYRERVRLQFFATKQQQCPGSATEEECCLGGTRSAAERLDRWKLEPAPEGRKKRPSSQISAVRKEHRKPRHLGESRGISPPSARERQKPGRARLQSCRQGSINASRLQALRECQKMFVWCGNYCRLLLSLMLSLRFLSEGLGHSKNF